MPSLGSISVNFTANAAGFSSSLQKINQAVRTTTAEFQKLNNVLSALPRGALAGIVKSTSKTASAGEKLSASNKKVSMSAKEETMSLEQAQAAMEANRLANLRNVKSGFMVNQTFRKVAGGGYKMAESLRAVNTAQKGFLAGLMNLGYMIKHYITFTIGVQMVMGLRRALESAIETFREFNKAATNTATVTGYLGAGFEGATQSIENFSREVTRGTIFNAVQAAQSMYSLASAGYDVVEMARSGKEGMEAFAGILDYATATQAELEDATKSVTVAIKQFKLDLEDINRVVDTFTTLITSSFLTQQKMAEALKYAGTIAGIVGHQIEEVGASIAVLTDRGMEGSQAGQRLNMIYTKLLKPTKEAQEVLGALGVTLNDINPKYHSMVEILTTLKAAGFGAAEASELFRARTAASAVSLVDNVEQVSYYIKKIKASAGITEAIADKQAQAFWGVAEQTKAALAEASTDFGENIEPVIMGLMNSIKDNLVPALKIIGDQFNTVGKIVEHVVPTLIGYKIALWAMAKASTYYAAAQKRMATLTASTATTTKMASTDLNHYTMSTQDLSGNIDALNVRLGRMNISTTNSLGAYGQLKLTTDNLTASYTGLNAEVGKTLVMVSASGDAAVASTGKWAALSASIKETAISTGLLVSKLLLIHSVISLGSKLIKGEADAFDVLGVALLGAGVAIQVFGKQLAVAIGTTQALLGPIGWLSIAIGAIISVMGLMSDETEENKMAIESASVAVKEYRDEINDTDSALNDYLDSRDAYITSLREERNIIDDINKLRASGLDGTKEYTDLVNKLVNAQTAQEEHLNNIIKATTISIAYLSDSNNEVSDAITAYQTLKDTDEELISTSKAITKARMDQADAQNEYMRMVEIYGSSSVEAVNAENEMINATQSLNSLLTDKRDLTEKLGEATEDYAIEEGKLVGAQRDALDVAVKLYDQRWLLYNLLEKQSKLTAEATMWSSLEGKYSKNLEESIKRLAEEKWKLYEIELKRYKLQHSQKDRAEDLFDALAAEGLLTDDIIEKYKDMETADGQRIKEQIDYAKVLNNFTSDQQRMISEWVEAYIDAGGDVIAANDKVGYSLESIPGMNPGYITEILEFGNASVTAEDALESFTEAAGAFAQTMVDADIAGEGVADALFDIKEAAYDQDTLIDDFNKALQNLADEGMQDVINQASKLWIGFGEFPEFDLQEWSLQDSFKPEIEDGKVIGDPFKNARYGLTEFKDTLKKINDEFGYFADKGSDIDTVYESYLQFMASQGVNPLDATSSAMATAAITYQSLIDKGYEHEEIMKMAGGDFITLGNMGTSALQSIETDAINVQTALENIETDIINVANAIDQHLDGKEIDIILNTILKETEAGKYDDSSGDNGNDVVKPGPTIFDFIDWLNPYAEGMEQMGYEKTQTPFGSDWNMDVDGDSVGDDMSESFDKGVSKRVIPKIETPFNEFTTDVRSMTPDIDDAMVGGANQIAYSINSTSGILQGSAIQIRNDLMAGAGEVKLGLQDAIYYMGRTSVLAADYFYNLVTGAGSFLFSTLFNVALKFDATLSHMEKILGYNTIAMLQLAGLLKFGEGGIVTSPKLGMIGEDGPEAIIPLVRNRDSGEDLLRSVLTNYYPDLARDMGGGYEVALTGGGVPPGSTNNTSYKEDYNFYGDINVVGIQNADELVDEFMDKLKERSRMY